MLAPTVSDTGTNQTPPPHLAALLKRHTAIQNHHLSQEVQEMAKAKKYRSILLSWAVGGLLLSGLFLLIDTSSIALAGPADLFVAPNGSGVACTRAQPCTLQTALAQATDGDAIYLAQGTYTGTGGAVITVTRSITLYGGWNGAASGLVVRDPGRYPTTVDGEGQRRGVYMSKAITVTLEGFTVTNGAALDRGAGLFAQDAYLTLRATTFYSNVVDSGSTAATFGGGAYVQGGSLTVLSSTFRANDAWCNGCSRTQGGGLYLSGPRMTTIEDSLIEANDAQTGGGLVFDGSSGSPPIFIRRTIFRDNGLGLSPGEGISRYAGGAEIANAYAVVEDSVFLHNRATDTGGAFDFSAAELTFTRNRIVGNSARNDAGLSIWNARSFTLTNNIITDNQASGVGVRQRSTGCLLHNTIARNSGYGIWVFSGMPVTLTNTILVSNTVGIYAAAENTATLEATLWGTGAWANGADWGGPGTIVTGTVNIRGNPRFVNPAGGDYHIGPGSAAIDAGVDAGVTTDIDGDRRPIGTGYDIGADEVRLYRYLPLVLKVHAR